MESIVPVKWEELGEQAVLKEACRMSASSNTSSQQNDLIFKYVGSNIFSEVRSIMTPMQKLNFQELHLYLDSSLFIRGKYINIRLP